MTHPRIRFACSVFYVIALVVLYTQTFSSNAGPDVSSSYNPTSSRLKKQIVNETGPPPTYGNGGGAPRWVQESSFQKISKRTFLLSNVCVVPSLTSTHVVYFVNSSSLSNPALLPKLAFRSDIFQTIRVPLHPLVITNPKHTQYVNWAKVPQYHEDLVVGHFVQHQYMANLAHVTNAIAAQLNAVEAWIHKKNSSKDVPWVLFSNPMQHMTEPNFYHKVLPLAVQVGGYRATASYYIRPHEKDDFISPMCYRRMLVGYESFPIASRPQDFSSLRSNVLSAIEHQCGDTTQQQQLGSGSSDDIVVLQRSHTRQFKFIMFTKALQKEILSRLLLPQPRGGVRRDILPKVQVVQLEQLSPIEQACVFRNNNVIIGMHGAGLAWAYVMKPTATFLQVCPFLEQQSQICLWYTHMAASVKVQRNFLYLCSSSEVTTDGKTNVILDETKWIAFVRNVTNTK